MPVVQNVTISADGNATVTYTYTRKSYKLTLTAGTGVATTSYESANSEGLADGYIYYNDTVTLSATPATGYEAPITWSKTAGTSTTPDISGDEFTMVAGEASYTATATASEFTITLNANAGG